MSAPSFDEYQQAVQNPGVAFADHRLRRARVRTSPLGMPLAYAGGFAIAFRVDVAGQSWALRCFGRPEPELRDRYQKISPFVGSSSLDFLVPVEYIEQGINVHGSWWPVTLMPWVEGASLNDWVEAHRADRTAIRELRLEFERVVARLAAAGAAHGDLQHGNVVVRPDRRLALIDYDGMFVPGMAGLAMLDYGHRNYQHPLRYAGLFDATLDRFSAIVIWTALTLVEVQPALWDRFDGGENLVFSGEDFSAPSKSRLLKALTSDVRGAALADALVRVASVDVAAVPSLGDFVAGRLPAVPAAPRVEYVPASTYPVADLRRGDVAALAGERAVVVGEVMGTKPGKTRRGDPYLFIDLGDGQRRLLRVVVWSEVLGHYMGNRAPVVRGEVVSITGLIGSYSGELQLELERPALLEVLEATRVRRLLGTSWEAGPPTRERLHAPRIGDIVEHDIHRRGTVTAVAGDVVRVRFPDGERGIQYTRYFLSLIQRAPSLGTPAPGAERPKQAVGSGPRSTRTNTTQATTPPGAAPRKPTPPGSTSMNGVDAQRLNELFGGAAPPISSTSSTAAAPPSRKPQSGSPPRASTQGSTGLPATERRTVTIVAFWTALSGGAGLLMGGIGIALAVAGITGLITLAILATQNPRQAP